MVGCMFGLFSGSIFAGVGARNTSMRGWGPFVTWVWHMGFAIQTVNGEESCGQFNAVKCKLRAVLVDFVFLLCTV